MTRMPPLAFGLLLTCTLLATVRGQQSIVSTNTISPGGKFTVTCDANKATTPSGVLSVQQLTISRNLTSSNSYSTIAQYRSLSPPGLSKNVTNIPAGRNWTFTFSGDNNGASGNAASMRIVWDVNDASCKDAGVYRCQIDYNLNTGLTTTVFAPDQNVTATTGLSNFALKVDPYNYYDYAVDDNVTFTCSVVGPATGVTFKWVLWVKDQYQSLPANNEIVPKPPTFQTGNTGCVQYNWTSMLRIQVPANYDQQTYKCIVTYLQQQESGNLTIGTTGERPSNVSTNTINSGGRFSIYCDASRASIPHNVYSVRALSIYRDVTSDNSFSTFFKYTSDVYFSSPATECPPRWRCTYTGVNSGINNTATMKIVLDVEKTMCSDSGTYRCVIDYILTNGSLPSVPAPNQVIRVTRSHPSIVSINSVPADGTFSIYCDASRADAPEAGVHSIQSLSIYKDMQGGSSALVALYNSINPPLFNANAKKIPHGSDWNITFSGDNHGSNNIATMKIVVDVNAVKYSDAGVYRCQIGYYLTVGGFTSVLAPDQKVMVLSKGQSSIVSTNSLTLGGTFVVYCDASRHDILHYLSDVYIYSVQTLSIYRMMETDSSYSLIALYNSVNPDFSADFKNIPAGRDWNITFSGGNDGSNNTDTMKIVWEVNDVMFSDAGMYRCQIGYYLKAGGLTSVLAPDQNVTVSGFCSG